MTKTELENSYKIRKQMAKDMQIYIPQYIHLYEENPNPIEQEPCEDMFKGNDNTRPYYANEWLGEHSEPEKIIGFLRAWKRRLVIIYDRRDKQRGSTQDKRNLKQVRHNRIFGKECLRGNARSLISERRKYGRKENMQVLQDLWKQ